MREHGTRSSYVNDKCRCEPCTEANRTYARSVYRTQHRPDTTWKPFISARETRDHLLALRRNGVGLRAVSFRTGLSRTTLVNIVKEEVTQIRRDTASKILGVGMNAQADGAIVDASRTWALIRRIKTLHNLTNKDIALMLGYKSPALQFRKTNVSAATARKVEHLARRLGVI